jgi:HEPN superfamily Swt1-like protein
LSNRDWVGRGLETLRASLAPFVERELKARLRGDWRTEVERGSRYEMRRDSSSDIVWDTSALFGAMLGQWDDVFRYTLGPPQRSLVHEIQGARADLLHRPDLQSTRLACFATASTT